MKEIFGKGNFGFKRKKGQQKIHFLSGKLFLVYVCVAYFVADINKQ